MLEVGAAEGAVDRAAARVRACAAGRADPDAPRPAAFPPARSVGKVADVEKEREEGVADVGIARGCGVRPILRSELDAPGERACCDDRTGVGPAAVVEAAAI